MVRRRPGLRRRAPQVPIRLPHSGTGLVPMSRGAAGGAVVVALLLALPFALAPRAAEQAAPAFMEPITPVLPPTGLDPARVRLGERLFRDPRLSRGGRVACATCHLLGANGADAQALSASPEAGGTLDLNTPTVFNAVFSFRLGWQGRTRSLEEQSEFILLSPRLMNMSWGELTGRLRADPEYRDAFAAAYGGRIERTQVLDALASFGRSLVTPDSRFDRHLRGERGALTPEEEAGYALFKAVGCIACHQGVNLGGNLFQRFGIFQATPAADRPLRSTADLGRFEITGAERDRHVFRVPSLRNVAVTPPYFHDGSAATLEDAVTTMARQQLGRDLGQEEVGLLAGFLRTLTGEYQGRVLTLPPPDGGP